MKVPDRKRCFTQSVALALAKPPLHDPASHNLPAYEALNHLPLAAATNADNNGVHTPDVAWLFYKVGNFEFMRQEWKTAQSCLIKARRIFARHHDAPQVANTLSLAALLEAALGQKAKAQRLFHFALRVLGNSTNELCVRAHILSTYGRFQIDIWQLDEADSTLCEACELYQTVTKDAADLSPMIDFHYRIACAYRAEVWRLLGRYESAQQLLEEVQQHLAPELYPLDFATVCHNLGHALRDQGERDAARREYQRACDVLSSNGFGNHPSYARVLSHLAGLRLELGDLRELLRQFDEALHLLRRSFGDDCADVAYVLLDRGRCCSALGHDDAALRDLREARELLRDDPSHLPAIAHIHILTGQVFEQRNEVSAAIEEYSHALEAYRVANSPYFADEMRGLVDLMLQAYSRNGQLGEGLQILASLRTQYSF